MYRLIFLDDSMLELPDLKQMDIETNYWDGKSRPKYLKLIFKQRKNKDLNLKKLKDDFYTRQLTKLFVYSKDGQKLEYEIPIPTRIDCINYSEDKLEIGFGDSIYYK